MFNSRRRENLWIAHENFSFKSYLMEQTKTFDRLLINVTPF